MSHRLTQDGLNEIEKQHRIWLLSDGKKGKKAEFLEIDFSGADFINCKFVKSDFTGADFSNANFHKANISSVKKVFFLSRIKDMCLQIAIAFFSTLLLSHILIR